MAPTNRLIFLIGMLSSVCLMLTGCSFGPSTADKTTLAPPPKLVDLAPAAESAQKDAQASAVPLQAAETAVNALPPSMQRQTAVDALAKLRIWWSDNLAAWNGIVTQAKAQMSVANAINGAVSDRDKQIASLKAENTKLVAGDPVVKRLNAIGLSMLVASIVTMGAAIWLNWPKVRALAFVLGGMGLAILTLAVYLHTLEWIIGGLALIAAGAALVYWLLHRKVSADVNAAKNSFAFLAGLVSPTPQAVSAPSTGGAALAGGGV